MMQQDPTNETELTVNIEPQSISIDSMVINPSINVQISPIWIDIDHGDRLKKLENIVYDGMPPLMRYFYKQIREQEAMILELRRDKWKEATPSMSSIEYTWGVAIDKTVGIAANMVDSFTDLSTRLSCYVQLIKGCEELLNLARAMGNRGLREAMLTLHDAICGIYSEELTVEQGTTIKEVLETLRNIDWDSAKVRELDSLLRQRGFETIPSDRFTRTDIEYIQSVS